MIFKWIVAAVLALGVTTVMGACGGTEAHAQPVSATLTDKGTPGPGWFDTRPIETPASLRRIEVVDHIGSGAWNVGKAVRWLDRYTASRMTIVPRCTHTAYRCITFRTGRVKGEPVGYTQGDTITIDVAKANGSMRYRYKYERNRTWLLTHELGHGFGLKHTGRTSPNLMNPYVNRYKMVLNAAQRRELMNR